VRKYQIFAAMIPILLLSHTEAKSFSAGDVFTACTSPDQTAKTMCAIYMTGFMDGMTLDQLTHSKICLPEGMTGNGVKAVFEKFMRENPTLQNEAGASPPGAVVGLALFQAYPCPGAMK
jgi:hypothetical protein